MSLQERSRSVSFEHLLQHTVGAAYCVQACVLNTNQKVCVFLNDSVSLEGEKQKEKYIRKKLQVKDLNGCVQEVAESIAARCGSPCRNNSP